MEKLKSSLPNMMLSLVLICVVAAGALAGVYLLTKAPIAEQKELKQKAALKKVVLPDADESVEIQSVMCDTIYLTAQSKKDTTKLDTINTCVVNTIALKDGTIVGKAVETGASGFGGRQQIMVGFDNEGKIINYEVLDQKETPGLGDHIKEWFKDTTNVGRSIIGRQATGKFTVTKTASTSNDEVEAITAATISSNAFMKAINHAYAALQKSNGLHVEAISGASQLQKEEAPAQETPAVEAATGATEQHPDSVAPAEHQCQGDGKCEGKCQGHCKHHCENQPNQETEVTK